MQRRAGTQNTLAIHAFGALIDILSDTQMMHTENQNILELKNFIEPEIKKINPTAIIVGETHNRAVNTICVISEGIDAEKQVIIADLNKVCISSGSACSSGKVKPSHVLNAYGYSATQAMSAIRVSLGYQTTRLDCEAFLKAYTQIIKRILPV
jgi:cysteine desulfurase